MGRAKHRRLSPEFKAEAVQLVTETDAPLTQIGRESGVTPKSLHDWVGAARPAPREPLTEDERSEVNRLRHEIKRVRMERDILKKATGFFARHRECRSS